jgi:hypothetical protein
LIHSGNHKLTGSSSVTHDRDILKLSNDQNTYTGRSKGNSHVLIYDPNDASFVLEDMTALSFNLNEPGTEREQLDLDSDDPDAYDYRRWIDADVEPDEDSDVKTDPLDSEDDYLTIEEDVAPQRAFRPVRPAPPIHIKSDSGDDEEERVQREASAASIAEAELEAELLQEMSKLEESSPRPREEEEESEEE